MSLSAGLTTEVPLGLERKRDENREHELPTRHARSDSRYDDTAEAQPDFEFLDKTESGELLAGASTRVTVIKVLPCGQGACKVKSDVDAHPHS